jgi:integrase
MKKPKLIRAKWPRIWRTSNHDNVRYLVDSRRAGFSQGRRSFHQTEADALATAEKLERDLHNEGASAYVDLSPAEHKAAAKAVAILAEYADADLVDAATHYVKGRKAREAAARAKTVSECIDAYLADKRADFQKGHITKFTLYELESKMRLVRNYLGEAKITAIDEQAVEAFLKNLPAKFKPRYRANIRTKLSQLLNFCRRQKWIATSPEIRAIKVPQSEVEILTVQEAKGLLRSAEASEHAENVVPYLAASLFAGLRPFEAQRLKWEQIDFKTKQIEIRGATSKTKETRYVEIEPVLAEWLRPFRKKNGPITGSNFRKDFEAVRESTKIERWPVDVLRHSFGSYWLPIHKNRVDLAEKMGNSIQIIKRHYRKAIPKHVAKQYWEIRPKTKPAKPTETGKVIEFPVAPQQTEVATR